MSHPGTEYITPSPVISHLYLFYLSSSPSSTHLTLSRSWSSLGASPTRHASPNVTMASGSGSGSGPVDKRAEKSTWASAVDSINPWAVSRSSTPIPKESIPPPPKPTNTEKDHSVNLIYGISARKYPDDCPPLTVQWFHAVDVSLLWWHKTTRADA